MKYPWYRALSLIPSYLKYNLMASLEYRGAFLLQVFGMVLNDVMLLFFWYVFYQNFPTMQGWRFQDILVLYAIAAGGFGVSNVVFGNQLHLARTIANGGLDHYLVLPADSLVHFLISRGDISAWGDLLFGVALFALVKGPDPLAWGLFILSLLASTLVFTSVAVLGGSLAFFLGQSEALSSQVVNFTLSFSLYPLDIFPMAARLALLTVIPAALMGSVPASLFRSFSWGTLAGLVAGVALLVSLALLVYRLGVKRYESGNLMAGRT